MLSIMCDNVKQLLFVWRIERQAVVCCRRSIFSEAQVNTIVNMVVVSNLTRLREIRARTIEDNDISQNIERVSASTLDRILQRTCMKQARRVPSERNSESERAAFPICPGMCLHVFHN